MNAHLKTITTMAISVGAIIFLCYHPSIARILYLALWAFLGLLVAGWIYWMIYTLFEVDDVRVKSDEFYFYGIYE